ncbi:MAG: hypothetical protein GX974_05340 [Clostridiales bacterium]|nr:hypothetical protein [Clostridiales bacterium]
MNKKGITYIEILISLFIFSLTMPAMIHLYSYIKGQTDKAKQELNLPYIAQEYIETIKAKPLNTLYKNPSDKGTEYRGYFFDYELIPYWNGYLGVTYYIVRDAGEVLIIDTPRNTDDRSHIVINAMKCELDEDIYIYIERPSTLDNKILYCRFEHLDKIHIGGVDDIIVISDSVARNKIIFKLSISAYRKLDDELPIFSISTLFEKEI